MSSFYTNTSKYGNYIEYRGYNDRGVREKFKTKFKPTLYFESKVKTKHTSLFGDQIAPVEYSSMKEAKNTIDMYQGVSNGKLFGNANFVSQYLQKKYPNKIEFDKDLIHVGITDIEVYSPDEFPNPDDAKHPISSICIHSSRDDLYYVFGTHESQKYSVKNTELKIDPKKIIYVHCKNEEQLLSYFLKLWKMLDLDVISGWYIRGFDIPYIVNRLERLVKNSSKVLSPWGRIYFRQHFVKGQELNTYEIVGIAQLDFIDAFKKFGYVYGPQESYRLDAIAYSVLGERKLDYSEYGNLATLYEKNYQLHIDYNIRDVDLVVRMEKETNLISLAITIAYMSGTNYTDALGTTAIWQSIMFRHMKNKNILPPATKNNVLKTDFPGGYVKEPIPNVYSWVCSFDLNSLYPNLIIQYNMSSETIIGMKDNISVDAYLNGLDNSKEKYTIAPNGAMFDKSKQGILPEIVESFYDYRKTIQADLAELEKNDGDKTQIKLLDNMQWAIKIFLNSVYGALSNIHFLYTDIRIAEATTNGGQLAIKWVAKHVNNYLNELLNTINKDYIIAIDTDSLYLNLEDIAKMYKYDIDKLDKFCKEKLQELVIKTAYETYYHNTNSFKNRMVMKREVIADRGLWTAKKRYILNVLDDTGIRYKKPKLKIMGIEAVRSTTPEIIREKMKESFKIFLMESQDIAHKHVDEFENQFKTLSPEDISFPKAANGLEKYSDKETIYGKGTPFHVRASLLYNKLLQDLNLGNKYQEIKSGDKIRYVYLKLPNPIHENVIGFPNVLPEEFGLHKYVDYKTQFQKGYKEPLRPIFNALQWSIDDDITLENFME